MESYFATRGELRMSIGEGYLSAYEVSLLNAGDTVTTAQLAGEGFSVFFNGLFLFTAASIRPSTKRKMRNSWSPASPSPRAKRA